MGKIALTGPPEWRLVWTLVKKDVGEEMQDQFRKRWTAGLLDPLSEEVHRAYWVGIAQALDTQLERGAFYIIKQQVMEDILI